jgi:hypothetical protein
VELVTNTNLDILLAVANLLIILKHLIKGIVKLKIIFYATHTKCLSYAGQYC